MILNEGNCPVAVLDSVEIHIEELIKNSMIDDLKTESGK